MYRTHCTVFSKISKQPILIERCSECAHTVPIKFKYSMLYVFHVLTKYFVVTEIEIIFVFFPKHQLKLSVSNHCVEYHLKCIKLLSTLLRSAYSYSIPTVNLKKSMKQWMFLVNIWTYLSLKTYYRKASVAKSNIRNFSPIARNAQMIVLFNLSVSSSTRSSYKFTSTLVFC